MSDTQAPANIYAPNLSLTKDERALLRTALSSNSPRASAPRPFGQRPASGGTDARMANGTPNTKTRDAIINNSSMYRSPDQDGPASGLEADTSPLIDFDLEDGNFDWDNSGDLFGDLPKLLNGDDTEHHDKRKKSMQDDDEEEEGSGKRREGDERTARKPGRKPLTGEPTTVSPCQSTFNEPIVTRPHQKRKAQNRAAQRAFRERKERHLKDLEMKVEDLEKASESTNHENGRLRAQVERLSNEVKEYRKRMSVTAPGLGRSPPTANQIPYNTYNTNNSNDFVFAFPKFGDLPGSNFMNNGSFAKTSPPALNSPNSARGSLSNVPNLARASSSQQSPTMKSPVSANGVSGSMANSQDPYQSPNTSFSGNSLDELNGLFSPPLIETARRSNSADYIFPHNTPLPSTAPQKSSSTDSYRGLANTPSFTQALSNGSTSSPSASSMSHAGLDSSCVTTPEPSADSPEHRKASEAALNTINEEATQVNKQTQGKKSFCNEWAKACGNIANPVPQTMMESNTSAALSAVMKSPANDVNGIDWMAQQNGGQFDPVLFGDYRDPQDNIMNTNLDDFFNDAFLTQDFTSPFNTCEITTPPQPLAQQAAPAKKDPMKQCDAAQNANDEPEVVPAKPKQFLACDKLWSVSARSRFPSPQRGSDV